MAVHTAVALPAETWTEVAAIAAGGSFSVTNPGPLPIKGSAVATDGDAPTGDAPCDFVAGGQTLVYDDADGADFYAWSAEPQQAFVRIA